VGVGQKSVHLVETAMQMQKEESTRLFLQGHSYTKQWGHEKRGAKAIDMEQKIQENSVCLYVCVCVCVHVAGGGGINFG